jgi:Zn-dependent peptidase ImmA (M78 family)
MADKDRKSLRELAARYGVSVNGLSRALKRAGVERAPVRRGRSPAPTAASASPDPRSIESRDWWPDFLARKDRQSLSTLARHFGVAEITLQRAMKRTGINRKSQRGAKGNRQAMRASRKLASHRDLLGTVADAEIAALSGVSRYAVAQYRKKHGIASVRSAELPLDAEVPPKRPSGERSSPARVRRGRTQEAYLVRVAGASERFIVIARDLAEAASTAQAGVGQRFAGGRKIEGLEYVGPAL